jgi:uncharacterized membrane protein YfcA
MEALPVYLALGAFAGVVAGLLGVGGGLLIVPVLAILFTRAGMEAAVIMHLAIGTSLATIVVTSLSSLRAHARRGAVRWDVVLALTPGIVLGALAGAVAAAQLPGVALRIVFGLFELAVALQMAFGLMASPHRRLPGTVGMTAAGGAIGFVSAILGIGGGTLTVPFLVWCNVTIRQAVATSAACGLPIAVAGAVGFVTSGWSVPGLPPGATGFLYWPAFVGIAATSLATAPAGAWLAHRLPTHTLRRLFAGFLALLGVRMLSG